MKQLTIFYINIRQSRLVCPPLVNQQPAGGLCRVYLRVLTVFLLLLAGTISSCTKFVEVPPPATNLVGASVYNSNTTAAAAVTGILQLMGGNTIGGGTDGISALLGLSADELILYPTVNSVLNQTYKNSLTGATEISIWSNLYNCIYQANLALEQLPNAAEVTTSLRLQLIGESKFIRAFCYYNLVNVYGGVPILTSTSYTINQRASKSSEDEVYNQIITDLTDAKTLLKEDYLTPGGTPSTDRVRPNRSAVQALLSRVYLARRQWVQAEAEADEIINSGKFSLLTDLAKVFLKNNQEAILQLEPMNTGFNTNDGALLAGLLYNGGPSDHFPILLSDKLVKRFEPGDLRIVNWITTATVNNITYYYPFKYKLYYTGAPPEEYSVLFRLAEQYLIRAEARAQQNKLSDAANDINIVRVRAGLSRITALEKEALLEAIYNERDLELFTEGGRRWIDLKRTGRIDAVMAKVTSEKGGVWKTTDQLFPIPLTDIQGNPNLIQNPGY